MLLDVLNTRVRTEHYIERVTDRAVIGSVMFDPSMSKGRLSVVAAEHSTRAESYKRLRTNLQFLGLEEGHRAIVVTSTMSNEGKTTTAINVAFAMATAGERVLLIDADMRRPGVHRTLGIHNETGLSHLLTGQATARQAIGRLAGPDFWVMTAGLMPPNPSELLASEQMKTLISTVKSGPFDWVIIDTPPVLAVTDAVIMTPWVSGVVFVIGSEMTQRRLAERAIETLTTSHPHLLGAVLNRVDIARNKYYYSRYYGYKYKRYYVESPAA